MSFSGHLYKVILHLTRFPLIRSVQIFDLFDVKKKGVIDFEDFVRSLNVFHPNVSLEDKIACKLIVKSSTQFILNSLLRDLAILIH